MEVSSIELWAFVKKLSGDIAKLEERIAKLERQRGHA